MRRIAELADEAARLVAMRSGVHDMHHAAAVVRGYAELAAGGVEPVPIERLEQLVARMRVCCVTGFFPKEHPAAA